jgi:hypothetical protein
MVPFAAVLLVALLAMLLFTLGAYVALMVLLSHGHVSAKDVARPRRRSAGTSRRPHLRVIRPTTKHAVGGAPNTLPSRQLVVLERRR